jgi:DegV family protein with EDD domain
MIKIVIDSTCDHEKILSDKVKTEVVPMIIDMDGETYTDDHKLNLQDYLDKMRKMTRFKTACSPPQFFEDVYGGDEDVIVLAASSRLSGVCQSASIARDNYFEHHGTHKRIVVLDSLSASSGSANILLKLNELVEQCMNFDEIIRQMEEFIKRSQVFFVLQNLNNLVKMGRVNSLVAAASSALNIRCLMGGENGAIVLVQKALGEKKCFKLLAAKVAQFSDGILEKTLCVSHCEALEKAEMFLDELSTMVDVKKFKEIVIQKTTGVTSMYAGIGGIVVGIVG